MKKCLLKAACFLFIVCSSLPIAAHAASTKQNPRLLVAGFMQSVQGNDVYLVPLSEELEAEIDLAANGKTTKTKLKQAAINLEDALYRAMTSTFGFGFSWDLEEKLLGYLLDAQRDLVKSYALRMSSMRLLVRYLNTEDSKYLHAYDAAHKEADTYSKLAALSLLMAHERVDLPAKP